MSPQDIYDYRVNYDREAWERITQGWRLHVAPPGAILAINALCDEVERMMDALAHIERVMGPKVPPCCDGCHYEWGEALKTVRAARKATP